MVPLFSYGIDPAGRRGVAVRARETLKAGNKSVKRPKPAGRVQECYSPGAEIAFDESEFEHFRTQKGL
jgi:hypothetical protein